MQNTMGNCRVERAKLSPGFIPMGMQEYGGIIYVASYNPDTKECEVGSFPSPERDITGSTKIEHQTGLQDGFFETDDYSVPVSRLMPDGEFNPDYVGSKLQKLNEESVLMLNPGDKFITTYEVKPISTPPVGADVVTDANFRDYFNDDPLNKKVFSINFYKIDAGNNIVKIPNNEIKTIKHTSSIDEDEYVYYNQTSSGSIAVGIEMNTLPYFSASVRETSKMKDDEKTIHIEAVGESDSDIEFKGVRVDVVNNNTDTISFHVENQGLSDKVSVDVTELSENDEVRCDITPYSDYGYLSDLLQSFNLKMGVSPSGQEINNIFKWRVDDQTNRLELDFDFLFETDNTLKMYLEFYDPWSNVSTIRTIPAPSIYGPMRLVMGLNVNEPKNTIFDPYPTPPIAPNPIHQKGGVPFSKLDISENNLTVPYLIDPAQSEGKLLIRNDNALRKNHFYIVRICGYEEDTSNPTNIVRTYHDVYRALYTSTAYNELYEEQRNTSPGNSNYRPNFCNEPFPIDKIKYSITKTGTEALSLVKTSVDEIPSTIPTTMMNGSTELFSIESQPSGTGLKINSKWKGEKAYNLSVTKPDNLVYSTLKANLLKITNTPGDLAISPSSIEDDSYNVNNLDPSVDMRMDTTAFVEIPDFNNGNSTFRLKFKLDTNRPIFGKYNKFSVAGAWTETKLSTLYYHPSNFSFNSCEFHPASHYLYRYRRQDSDRSICNKLENSRGIRLCAANAVQTQNWYAPEHILREVGPGGAIDDELNAIGIFDALPFNFFSIGIGSRIHDAGSNTANLLVVDKVTPRMIMFPIAKRANAAWSMSIVRDTLSQFSFKKYANTPSSRYNIPANNILYYTASNLTKIRDVEIEINSGWSNVTAKTYIFDAYFKALGGATDFNLTNVNTLITNAITRSGYNVVETSPTLGDVGFIPFLMPGVPLDLNTFVLKLDDETISVTSDDYTLNLMNRSEAKYQEYIASLPPPDMSVKNIETTSMDPAYINFCKYIAYDPVADAIKLNWNDIPKNAASYARPKNDTGGARIRSITSSSTTFL